MKSICSLNIVDNILLETMVDNTEFREFSNIMTNLTSFTDSSLYLEGVKDTTIGFNDMGKIAKKNTLDTTKDIAGAYTNVTDANANVIKSTWDIFMRAVQLISRALSYIINKISNIPKFILQVADRAMDIPAEVKGKIRGDITLYITANDVGNIYNKLMIRKLTEYMTLASELSKGEFFTTFFHRHHSPNHDKDKSIDKKISTLVFGTNDMKLCRKMDDVYTHLQNMEFRPTVINMKDDSIVDVYFGNAKNIKFTDTYGKKHECSYYEALNILIKDLSDKKKELENIHSMVGDKLRTAETNQTYNKLSNADKYRLSTTINQITKVVTITGNFIKFILTDLNTINNSVDKILNKVSNLPKVDGKKAAETPATKVNTKI